MNVRPEPAPLPASPRSNHGSTHGAASAGAEDVEVRPRLDTPPVHPDIQDAPNPILDTDEQY
jgi:hypothetical protein